MKKLVLVNLSGSRYGVWRDDVIDIKKVSSVHRLPLRQEHLAGIGLSEDGHTITFFDLGVCMGHAAFDRSGPGLALIVSGGDRPLGFIAGCDAREAEAAPGNVIPMPEYLNAPELDSCALIDGELIPVINIGVLYNDIGKKGWNRPCLRLKEGAARRAPGRDNHFRVFGLDGLPFALPGGPKDWDVSATEPDRVRRMPLAPKNVEGIVFRNGRAAIVDGAGLTGLADGKGRKVLFIERSSGLGLIADSDMGVISGGPLKPMPPLVSSAFMKHGVIRNSDVIPLIDIRALLGGNREEAASGLYTPSPGFASSFGKEEVSVQEFSLPGVRHSLPSSEVEDIVDFRPYRRLAESRKIACGVAEFMGGILPVIDLAFCFGRRTEAGAGSKMILVKNGDFRALLLTGDVSKGWRRALPIEEQKRLPIQQPENYVYGCYLDGAKVRLILNVEALAANFVKEDAGGYFSRMVEELEKGSKPPQEILSPGKAFSGKGAAREQAEKPVAAAVVKLTPAEPAAERLSFLPKTGIVFEMELNKAGETRSLDRSAAQGKACLETKAATGIIPAGEPQASKRLYGSLTGEDKPLETHARKANAEKASRPEGKYEPFFFTRDGAHEAGGTSSPNANAENKRVDEHGNKPAIEQKLSFGGSNGSFEPVYLERELEGANSYLKKKLKRRRRALVAMIAALTLAVMYFALWPAVAGKPAGMKAAGIKPGKQDVKADKDGAFAGKTGPVKAEPYMAHAATAPRDEVAGPKALAAGEEPPETQSHKGALLLEIAPAKKEISARPVESEPYGAQKYFVEKGDTLWDIAKRFTGDPFNYPNIAANSRIKDPDVIFPGQEVFVRIKKE